MRGFASTTAAAKTVAPKTVAPKTVAPKTVAAITAAVLVLTAGCTSAPPSGGSSANPPAGNGNPARQFGVATSSRQTKAEADKTLASLHQIGDALYEMTYEGDYDPLAGIDPVPPAKPFGCSLFATAGMFARNFDWEEHPAMVLRTRAPGKFASLSIVDMAYLEGRTLDAPLLPFDGMNEKGLAVGLAADDSAKTAKDPAKRTVGGVRVLRLILDSAATVEEAVAVLDRYNLDFDGGPALHYLFADRSGASAVVEFIDGKTRVERSGPPWQALTNIRLVGASQAQRQADRRYRIASGTLGEGGVRDFDQAMAVLRSVAQNHTRWSAVYDLEKAEMRLVWRQRWDQVQVFKLAA